MPLPRYSLDDGAEASDEETFNESYAFSSRLPPSSNSHQQQARAGSTSYAHAPPSVSGRRSTSPPSSAYGAGAGAGHESSLDIDALIANSTSNRAASGDGAHSIPATTSASWPYDASSEINGLPAFEQLTLFFATQKAAPEILPFPTTAFETLISQMEQQQSILDSLLHLSSSTSSDDADADALDEDEHLRLNLVQVDLERSKWLLKQILRSRMDLVQKHAGFIQASLEERRKLNASEARFVAQVWALRKEHFHASVLGVLPPELAELDRPSLSQQEAGAQGSSNMVPGPDLDSPVFARCLQACGSISLPDGEQATLSKDSVHLLRYRSIRHLVYQASVVLL